MARVDLHVHSKYSDYPSEWILQKLGTAESYMELEDVYRMAKSQGMDFVTITDHNTIEGAIRLNQRHPKDTFVGVEVTTAFPEDGCKMHLLVYDITQEQFKLIDRLRPNIYDLRDYLLKARVPHSLAHATYAVNGKLRLEVFEKLILLFDVFEGINGARNPRFNHVWMETLKALTPRHIERLYKKHKIEPASQDPWIKGFTGGSDDHAGLFIAKTYTQAEARTKEEFLENLLNKNTLALGRSNNFKALAYTFYKIGYDYSKFEGKKKPNRMWRCVNRIVFENRGPSLKDAYILHRLRTSDKPKDKILAKFIDNLELDLVNYVEMSNDDKVNCVYRNLTALSDDFVNLFFEKFGSDIDNGEAFKLIKRFTNIFPIALISAPFLATLKHLFGNRELLDELKEEFNLPVDTERKQILWFTDTVNDLNGVSVTLRNIAKYSHDNNLPVSLVTSLPGFEKSGNYSPNVVNLPSFHSYTPDFYKNYTMHFPSLLQSIDAISQENPSEIIISTPGPVGLIGLLAAKLLNVKCTGIFHTDFTRQLDYIIGDGLLPSLFENYTRWFYSALDEIRVPTKEYIGLLAQRGYDRQKMGIFKRGIDTDIFKFDDTKAREAAERFQIKRGFNLLYTGRVSKDKSTDFLADVYKTLLKTHPETNLIIAGKGPALEDLKTTFKDFDRVTFTGMLERHELVGLYSLADLFVFPSTTDTFGMVVLEAQSCGLPSLVSDVGGPQEIVENEKTGFVIAAHDKELWLEKIRSLQQLKAEIPSQFLMLRKNARVLIEAHYSWQSALQDICESKPRRAKDAQTTGRLANTASLS